MTDAMATGIDDIRRKSAVTDDVLRTLVASLMPVCEKAYLDGWTDCADVVEELLVKNGQHVAAKLVVLARAEIKKYIARHDDQS